MVTLMGNWFLDFPSMFKQIKWNKVKLIIAFYIKKVKIKKRVKITLMIANLQIYFEATRIINKISDFIYNIPLQKKKLSLKLR